MTGPFRPGDILGIDIRGRQFLALYEAETEDGDLSVKPLAPNISYYTVRTRDVVTLWRKSKGKTPTVVNGGRGVRLG